MNVAAALTGWHLGVEVGLHLVQQHIAIGQLGLEGAAPSRSPRGRRHVRTPPERHSRRHSSLRWKRGRFLSWILPETCEKVVQTYRTAWSRRSGAISITTRQAPRVHTARTQISNIEAKAKLNLFRLWGVGHWSCVAGQVGLIGHVSLARLALLKCWAPNRQFHTRSKLNLVMAGALQCARKR